ncbi:MULTISPECIES: AraC family transcriptional regulator [Amycolatopsis]|uniref:AraC family transcriptional regulator n=1 Tax=Amycolatopsis thermoflava TaxID=84480 RepID=A0A3N2GVN5_9PSEU|nr:AraC family transcriptional regulator [Amycolatopsis thermoflava]ROS40688.1 AraC family transcriptional regulator [Amycolatopsis thermoflava]
MTVLPLDKYRLFHSRDVDETRERVGRLFCPHSMNTVGRNPRLNTKVNCRRLENVAIAVVAYGTDVRVEPGELGSFYVVLAPVIGRGMVQCGREQINSAPDTAGVVGTDDPLRMRLSDDCAQFVIRIERPALEARLAELIDGSVSEPVRFRLGMDITRGYGRSWYRELAYGVSELDQPDTMLSHPAAVEQFERNLITGLLLAQPHNYTAMIEGRDRPVPSRSLRAALDLIHSHPEAPHTPGSLAHQAGVSVRALQKAFREQLGSSPSEYLRGVRLQRVRDELSAAQVEVTTVGEIASKYGLMHHGRFAAAYRERFGESPNATLHRRSGRLLECEGANRA